MTGITHLMTDDLRLFDFAYISYHTGAYFLSVKICRSLWSHMMLITHEMHVELISYYYLIMIP